MEGRETTRMKNRAWVSVVADSDGSDQPDHKTADKIIELINDKEFFYVYHKNEVVSFTR